MPEVVAYVVSLIFVFIVISAVNAARRKQISRTRQRVVEKWERERERRE